MPLAASPEAPSYITGFGTVKGGRRGERTPNRIWIDWEPSRGGFTCDHCLHGNHPRCFGTEEFSGGQCKCNICYTPTGRRRGADAQEKVKQRPATQRAKPGPRPKAVDPSWRERIQGMRDEGKSWREIAAVEGVDHSGLRRKFLK